MNEVSWNVEKKKKKWKEKCEMTANSKQSYDEDNVRMNCSPT